VIIAGSRAKTVGRLARPEIHPWQPWKRACLWQLIAAALLATVSGCSGKVTRPRSRDDIAQDRLKVDTLFITKDGQRLKRPMNPDGAVIVDAAAGTLAWPAWQCINPDCPGRGADGAPFLFPWPDPFRSVKPDGTIVVRQPDMPAERKLFDDFATQKCPACLEKRTPASESKEKAQQYKDWCQPHVTASAAKRLAELDRELQKMMSGLTPPQK
jgi:hypothetical protein